MRGPALSLALAACLSALRVSAHDMSTMSQPVKVNPQPPTGPADTSDILPDPPGRKCADGVNDCYTAEQLQKVSQNLKTQYGDVRITDDNVVQRALHYIGFSRRKQAENLGEVATRTLTNPRLIDANTMDPQSVRQFMNYLGTEKSEIAKIDGAKPGQTREQVIKEAAAELDLKGMDPLEGNMPLHRAIMWSGDPLTREAMSGEQWSQKTAQDPAAWTQAAQDSFQDGNYKASAQQAGKALDLGGDDAAAHSVKSSAEYNQGDLSAAAADAKAALKLNPDDKTALSVLELSQDRDAALGSVDPGSASPEAGQAQTAAAPAAGPASDLKLTSPSVAQSAELSKQARTAAELGDSEKAIALADKALALNARNAEALAARAAAHNAAGDHEAALKDAAAALALSPKSGFMLNAKAYALNKQKKYQAALDAASASLALNPKDAYALANKAYALGALGDKRGMLAALKAAAEIDARFKSSLESALQAPVDGDVVFLFPGEDGSKSAAKTSSAGPRVRRFGQFSLAVILGGLLLGMGLVSMALPPLTAGFTRFLRERGTKHPAVSAFAAKQEGEELKKL